MLKHVIILGDQIRSSDIIRSTTFFPNSPTLPVEIPSLRGVLRQQGFVNLDPMKCFEDASGRSFGRCCSVGDYAEECWNGRGGFCGDCGDMENRPPIKSTMVISITIEIWKYKIL